MPEVFCTEDALDEGGLRLGLRAVPVLRHRHLGDLIQPLAQLGNGWLGWRTRGGGRGAVARCGASGVAADRWAVMYPPVSLLEQLLGWVWVRVMMRATVGVRVRARGRVMVRLVKERLA